MFKEFKVYVHPYGVVDLAHVFRKKMPQAETPLEMIIYRHGREDFLYQRYRRAWCERRLAEGGSAIRVDPAGHK